MMVPLYSLFVLAETVNDDGNRSLYTYKIINKYPHNTEDFTEGLIYEKGIIYESTGQYGKSKMKKYKLGSIEPLKSYSLPMMYFGEGATILENKIYQLTWKSRVGFVYNKDLKLLGNFNYKTRGWGLTTDGKSLIMSDGTNRLFYQRQPDCEKCGGSLRMQNDQRKRVCTGCRRRLSGRRNNQWQPDFEGYRRRRFCNRSREY